MAEASIPAKNPVESGNRPLLEVSQLKKYFPIYRGVLSSLAGYVYAVDGVSFSIDPGETLGLVGESGCGKSTTGKTILRLVDPTAGSIKLNGIDITRIGKREMRLYRRDIQVIFQDPYSSLNPRMSAGAIVEEPLINYGIFAGSQRRRRVNDLFHEVGLAPQQMRKYPHEFSGGQRQRLGIARALALNPKLIIADEPVSALDVSIQAQVINLMMDLQAQHGLAYLFIAHDLAVVEHISRRIAVMYLGRIVELAGKKSLFKTPLHPYTRALLSAVPVPDPRPKRKRTILVGDVPNPARPPTGCRFHTRCPDVHERCRSHAPPLQQILSGHFVACHLYPLEIPSSAGGGWEGKQEKTDADRNP